MAFLYPASTQVFVLRDITKPTQVPQESHVFEGFVPSISQLIFCPRGDFITESLPRECVSNLLLVVISHGSTVIMV